MLFSFPIACSQKESKGAPTPPRPPASAQAESYPNLGVQAKEVNDAFSRKDFARVVELTYPKLVESLGGREQMVSSIVSQLKDMEAEGVTIISSTAAAPTQTIKVGGSVYAVLPTVLKVKARDGMFQSEGAMIGISSDGGQHWTFLDAGGKDRSQIKSMLPDVADKLDLPKDQRPVKVSE